MQIRNKRQILTTLISVLVSVFLVATAVYATTTIGEDVAVGDALTVGGTLGVAGATTLSGDVTLGDAIGDTVTINGIVTQTYTHSSNDYATPNRNVFTWDTGTDMLAGGNYGVIRANLDINHAFQYGAALVGRVRFDDLTGDEDVFTSRGLEATVELDATQVVNVGDDLSAVFGAINPSGNAANVTGDTDSSMNIAKFLYGAQGDKSIETNGIQILAQATDAAIYLDYPIHIVNQGVTLANIYIQNEDKTNTAVTNDILMTSVSGDVTTGINMSGAVYSGNGLTGSAAFEYGTYSNSVNQGTLTTHLIASSVNVTGIPSGSALMMGNVARVSNSAASAGGIMIGHYGYVTLAYNNSDAYAVRGRVDITANSALGLTNALMGEVNVDAVTITNAGSGSVNGLHIDMNITAGAAVAQDVHGILINTGGILADVVGTTSALKIEHGGSGIYLDYGIWLSNNFDNATAGIFIEATQGNLATGIKMNSGSHTMTTAIELDGLITTGIDMSGATIGTADIKLSSGAMIYTGSPPSENDICTVKGSIYLGNDGTLWSCNAGLDWTLVTATATD